HRAEGRREDVGVRALDALTLLVELERPVGYLLQLLSHVSWYPVPRHAVEMHGAAWTEVGNLVTNGPFRLAAWKRGESLFLARNPTYHGWPRVRGNVQQVNLFPLKDWSARLQLYEADGLDVLGITFFPPAERDNARQQHIGEYISSRRLETHFLAFDVRRPPFDDVRVRRAFALATDRETLADVVMRGYVAPATGGLLPPGMPGHSPGIALPYDPQQARRLLAEAGYPDGRGFPVVDALGFRAAESRSEYLQAHWRENLGIEIAWETVEWAEFLDRLGNEIPHLTSLGWVADYPDPDSFLRVSRARSWAGWQNATYDRLVKEAGQVMCQGERMKLYRQADRILVEEAPILPLIYERDHLLVKPWVSRYPLSAIKPSFWKDVVLELH
ncbi:MAG: peptide ABC transporter substrate-binding protein, partial [Chloroflexota bacterium]|nr:peptide ABC transporter substrate-binding protein [Chloroflexota bacterium]